MAPGVGGVVVLRFTPVTEMLFSWGGSYTWSVTGPTAEPHAMPLPLPSTVAGALAAIAGGAGLSAVRVDLPQLASIIGRVLGEGFRLRGPLAAWRGGLYALSGSRLVGIRAVYEGVDPADHGFFLDVSEHAKRGVALSYTTKTAVEQMLYSVRYTGSTARGHVGEDEYQVHVEVLDAPGCGDGLPGPLLAQLGGDRGLALLECGKPEGETLTSLAEQASNAIAEAVEGRADRLELAVPVYVVSPAPLHPREARDLVYTGRATAKPGGDGALGRLGARLQEALTQATVEEVTVEAPSLLEVAVLLRRNPRITGCAEVLAELDENEEYKSLAKASEPRITLTALGFDAKAGRLRPMHPAIAPGSLLVVRVKLSGAAGDDAAAAARRVVRALYEEGIAATDGAARLGWGTILPLPRNRIPARAVLDSECKIEPRPLAS